MAAFIMNSTKDKILPVRGLKLEQRGQLTSVLVDSDDSLFTPVYDSEQRGLAELVFEDLGKQMATGEILLQVCEPENRRMVELTMDQLDYLMGLVEADEGKHEDNTEGDYHLRQMQEQTIKVLGRYF